MLMEQNSHLNKSDFLLKLLRGMSPRWAHNKMPFISKSEFYYKRIRQKDTNLYHVMTVGLVLPVLSHSCDNFSAMFSRSANFTCGQLKINKYNLQCNQNYGFNLCSKTQPTVYRVYYVGCKMWLCLIECAHVWEEIRILFPYVYSDFWHI